MAKQLIFWLIGLFTMGALLSSCSLIGFSIGAISDARQPDSIVVTMKNVSQLTYGKDVVVQLTNGHRVHGYFIGIQRVPTSEYAEKFKTFVKHAHLGQRTPRPGQPIVIQTENAHAITGKFLGVDKQKIYLLIPGDSIVVHPLKTTTSIIALPERRSFSPIYLQQMALMAQFPRYQDSCVTPNPMVQLEGNLTQKVYSPEEIEYFVFYPRKMGKMKGFMIGLGIDAAMAIWIAASLEYPEVF